MQTPSSDQRLTGIDVLRLVSVLLVLGRHTELCPDTYPIGNIISRYWIQGGWIGVDIFFVLSGFLVSGLLFQEKLRTGSFSPKRFLIRRGLKIYPAFYTLIGITVLVEVYYRHSPKLKHLFPELLFYQNYHRGLWNHTWSLAVEEHFYLLILLLTPLLNRGWISRANTKVILISAGSLFVLFIGARFYTAEFYPTYDFAKQHITSHLRMDSLLFGVVISFFYYYFAEEFSQLTRRYRAPLFMLGIAFLSTAFLFPVEKTSWIPTIGFSMYYLGAGMLVCGILAKPFHQSWITSTSAYIGRHSYSIYLWHMPVAAWVLPSVCKAIGQNMDWRPTQVLIYVVLSILIGLAASMIIEFPILRLRDAIWPTPPNVVTNKPKG